MRHFEVLRSIQTKQAFSVFKDGPVPLKPLSATHRLRSLHYFANPNAHSLYPHRETKNETLPWALCLAVSATQRLPNHLTRVRRCHFDNICLSLA